MTELTEILGIGEKSAEKLKEKGITTAEVFCTRRPEEIASILGITIAKAKELHAKAKDLVLSKVVVVLTGKEFEERKRTIIKYIPTGIKKLDVCLGKPYGEGVPTDALMNVYGEWGAGKTQLCMTIAVNSIPILGRPVIFIETEPGTFSMARLREIAEKRQIALNEERDVFVIPASVITSPFTQFLAYEIIEKNVAEGKLAPPGVIVVDSFSAKIREYYPGREVATYRSQEIARHIGKLQELASKFNCAVLLTSQVYGVPDVDKVKESYMKFGDDKVGYGGDFLLHSVSINLMVRTTSAETGEVITIDVPWAPRERIPFKITERGVEDV